MTPQTPAKGILDQSADWGNSRTYHVECDCTDPHHAHTVEIDVDEFGVQVVIYADTVSRYGKSRFSLIWEALTTGRVETQTSLLLQEQQALNYAETLKTAIEDVKEFRNGVK